MVFHIKKTTRNNTSLLSSGMVMRISLFISFFSHAIIFLVFQQAFPGQWKEKEFRTYRIELIRPPVEDMEDEEIPETEIARAKEHQPPPPEETQATISLETADKRYMPYAKILKAMISRHWRYPPEAKDNLLEGKLMVLFSLAKKGNLVQVEITRNSGHEILDQEALRAIRTAAPFPPFPEHIAVSKLNIKVNFDYRLTARK